MLPFGGLRKRSSNPSISLRNNPEPPQPHPLDHNDILQPDFADLLRRPSSPSTGRQSGRKADHVYDAAARSSLPASRPAAPTTRLASFNSRHASDSQIALHQLQQGASDGSSDGDAAPAPTIGMTPHTQKQKRKFPQLSLRSRSFNAVPASRQTSLSAQGPLESGNRYANHIDSFEVPSRPSISSSQGAPQLSSLDSQMTPPTPISRPSNGSLDNPELAFSNRQADQTNERVASAFFKIRRKKKANEHLFPLPIRPFVTGTTELPDRMQNDTMGPPQHPTFPHSSDSLPLISQRTDRFSSLVDRDWNAPIMPGLPHSATAPPSRFPILRQGSSTSARSARSSPGLAFARPRSFRGRSSTLSSNNEWLEDNPTAGPAWAGSGRSSMASATLDRNSVTGLRSLTSRFRNTSELTSPQRSRQVTPLASNGPSNHNSFAISRDQAAAPPREEGETAGKYFTRIEKDIPKRSIALLMSRSGDPFSHDVLRSLMRTFKFFEDPMDMSIRRFLWEIALPAEAQQIDRVIAAFAERYHECNPHIFDNSDQAYLVAYSLVILHSDLFNKNNKRKMQRGEYQRNTSGAGIHDDILGYLYDNIQYTEFIAPNGATEDPEMKLKNQARRVKKMKSMIATNDSSKSASRDPYDFIIDASLKLDALRPQLKDILNLEDTFDYHGTAHEFDAVALHTSFHRSGILQIVSARSRPDAFTSPSTISNPIEALPGVVDIKIVKVGILWRKDSKKKKTRSPWQEWGAILTLSQLYFFRNTGWVKGLMHQSETHQKQGNKAVSVVFKPPLEEFRPDFVVPTLGGVAVLDSSYRKHKNAFFFARQSVPFDEVLLAESEAELNDWIGKLNYAAAFTTTNIVMRPPREPSRKSSRNQILRGQNSGSLKNGERSVSLPAQLAGGQQADILLDARALRRMTLEQKILTTETASTEAQDEVNDLLKTGRHLQILVPFPSKTRQDLEDVGGRTARNLRWARYRLCHLKCMKEILASELADDDTEVASNAAGRAHRSSPTPRAMSNVVGAPKEHQVNSISNLGSHSESLTSSTTDNTPNRTCLELPLTLGAPLINDEFLKDSESMHSIDILNVSPTEQHLAVSNPAFARNNSIASTMSSIHGIMPVARTTSGGTSFGRAVQDDCMFGQDPTIQSREMKLEGNLARSIGSPDSRSKSQINLQLLPSSQQRQNRIATGSVSSSNENDISTDELAHANGSFMVNRHEASGVAPNSEWVGMFSEKHSAIGQYEHYNDSGPSATRDEGYVDGKGCSDHEGYHNELESPTEAGAEVNSLDGRDEYDLSSATQRPAAITRAIFDARSTTTSGRQPSSTRYRYDW